ncbi:MAG: class I SAM-dependent methyltransferase [Bacteroidia bacterium]
MEDQIKRNEAIWDTLAQNDVLCSRPKYDLTPEKARAYIGKSEYYGGDLAGKKVLCLACGGGQQSIAFALLGANVTVVDFSAEQLSKDQLVAEQFSINMRLVKTDMQELSMFQADEFDFVYQPYSLNYIPQVDKAFDEVARVLKAGGIYDLMIHNPFVHGTWKDGCWGSQWEQSELWEGKGYPIWQPYQDAYPIKTADPNWNFSNQHDEIVKLASPQEYRHTLSTVLNGLIQRGLEIRSFKEETASGEGEVPGSWEHYKSCAPPWLYLISQKK